MRGPAQTAEPGKNARLPFNLIDFTRFFGDIRLGRRGWQCYGLFAQEEYGIPVALASQPNRLAQVETGRRRGKKVSAACLSAHEMGAGHEGK